MRIGIDARFYGSIGKGLGRYTQKLIENLEKTDLENQYFIFLKKENFAEYEPRNPNFQKILADYRWYTVAEQVKFPWLLQKYQLDLVHFPHFNVPLFYRGRFVVTIHDLILIHYPTVRNSTLHPFFYKIKFLAYRLVIHLAIRRATKIIAVSNFTRADILDHYRVRPEKIIVTYEACDDFQLGEVENSKEILQKYGLVESSRGIIKPYIVYIGNVYPHKNADALVEAFLSVNKSIPHLKMVFIGGEDYFYQRLKQFVEERGTREVVFTGRLSDAELGLILSRAAVYARPSLYEGFELPPLEAMSLGVPVICSDHNCAREILADAPCDFDPHDSRSITHAITRVLQDQELRARMIENGFKQVQKYSWQKMVRETLAIYKGIIPNGGKK
jgi:glycosyltransferase involved in cell wall biosynthesis